MTLLATVPAADMTVAELVDSFGIASAHYADAKKRKEALRDTIAAFGDGKYEGLRYRATVSTAPVTRIVPELVRELLSPEDVELVSKTADETRVRPTARNGR